MALAHFQRTFTDLSGNVQSGVYVTVSKESDGSPATLFSDTGGSSARANPFATSLSGYADFFVETGIYRIQATGIDWRYVDIIGQPDEPVDLSDLVIRATSIAEIEAYSAPVGDVFVLNAGGRTGIFDVVAGNFVDELDADTLNGVYIGQADDPTATTKVARRRLDSGFVSPGMYGAVGDDTADDTAAVLACLKSDFPVDWGNQHYRTTAEISPGALTAAINWRSSGAIIKLDTATPQQSVINCEILPGLDHIINGPIFFDANNNAYAGCIFENVSTLAFPDGYANFYAEGLSARNIYRSGTTFSRGDGIFIRGGFKKVILDNPVVENCVMAVGAGIEFVVGVSGIAVARGFITDNYPIYARISNPTVRNVRSEDSAYELDQDGIRIFGAPDNPGEMFTSFEVIGGELENCHGRSIKGQMRTGSVRGTTFKRNAGFASRVGLAEVEFQTGEGRVTNIACYYDDYVPSVIVGQIGSSHTMTAGSVSQVDIYTTGSNVPIIPSIVQTVPRSNSFSQKSSAYAINVFGACEQIVTALVPDEDAIFNLYDCYAQEITNAGAVIKASGASPSFNCNMNMSNITNAGAEVLLIEDRISGTIATAIGSQYNCFGFSTSQRRFNSGDPKEEVTKIKNLAGDYVSGGLVSIYSETIANGASFGFPAHGFYGAAVCTLTAGNSSRQSATFSKGPFGTSDLGSGDQVNIASSSSNVSPGSGLWRVWCEAGIDGKTFVENQSGSSRVVTLMMVG